MKRIPSALWWLLVEAALDQKGPSTGLRDILQMILERGEHPDMRTLPE